jgi:hypothetical protein
MCVMRRFASGSTVRDQGGGARAGDQRREVVGNAHAPFGSGQQNHAAIGCQAPNVERGNDFPALHGWETELRQG